MNRLTQYLPESVLILIGFLIFVLALTADWFLQGSPGIGWTQFVGMTSGAVFVFIGSRHFLFPDLSKWDAILFFGYLVGILFIGLWPGESGELNNKLLLNVNRFTPRDFVLNIVGLIPLGFLLMPLLRRHLRINGVLSSLSVVALIGLTTSLAIEVLQFLWIPGRFSSAYDLLGNTFGTIVGALGYLFLRDHQKPLQRYQARSAARSQQVVSDSNCASGKRSR